MRQLKRAVGRPADWPANKWGTCVARPERARQKAAFIGSLAAGAPFE